MTKPDEKNNQTVVITDSVMISSQARGTTLIDDVVVGYTESPLDGRAAHASLGPNGISHGLSGLPPTNEIGSMETCTYLVVAMNKAGEAWGYPVAAGEHDDADALCRSLGDGDETLRIQVVRAHSDSAFWKEVYANWKEAHPYRKEIPAVWKEPPLNVGATMSGTSAELAGELKAPIVHKANLLAPAQRGQLVLALSALHTPGYVLGDVAAKFRELHGEWAGSLGFRGIWLVGPGVDLTHQLA